MQRLGGDHIVINAPFAPAPLALGVAVVLHLPISVTTEVAFEPLLVLLGAKTVAQKVFTRRMSVNFSRWTGGVRALLPDLRHRGDGKVAHVLRQEIVHVWLIYAVPFVHWPQLRCESLLHHQFDLIPIQRDKTERLISSEESAAEGLVAVRTAGVRFVLINDLNLPLRPFLALGRRYVITIQKIGDLAATPAPLVA